MRTAFTLPSNFPTKVKRLYIIVAEPTHWDHFLACKDTHIDYEIQDLFAYSAPSLDNPDNGIPDHINQQLKYQLQAGNPVAIYVEE